MMRNDGDTRPTKFFVITKVIEVYILASDETDALEMAEKGYGIACPFRNPDIREIEEHRWYAGIQGAEDDSGGWYNGDGTAWFYNDESHDLYRLDVEKRMWFPVDGEPHENFSDGEEWMFADDPFLPEVADNPANPDNPGQWPPI